MNIFHLQNAHKAFNTLTKKTIYASSMILAAVASAQENDQVEEVIVTAQKKSENLQDVPISVTNLSSDDLESLNIRDFYDYVNQLPSVQAIQRRPGDGTLFMRGISDGGSGNNQSLQGSSVATYLDETPVTMISDNLEVHMYDIERVEALAGPQGTLYGAASQAGNLKIITKKPTDEFDSGFNVGIERTTNGSPSNMVEGFVNIPLTKNAAVRIVGYEDKDGGYIDNVPDTLSYPLFGSVTNADMVEEDFNESIKAGFRAALRVNLSDSWLLDASVVGQEMETDGMWDHDPDRLGNYKIGRFTDDYQDDDFTRFALTVEGDLGFADLTFATSSMEKDFESVSDYSHYSLSSAYVEAYYTCYTYYFYACVDPSMSFDNDSTVETDSTEIRLSSKDNAKLNWIIGSFVGELETDYNTRWRVKDLPAGATVPTSENAYYQTDQIRVDEEKAVFGELYYQISDKLNLTVGHRKFDYDSKLNGFVGTIFYNPNPTMSAIGAFATDRPDNIDATLSGSDSVTKVNLSYDVSDKSMVYVSRSEGYRPGGTNRSTEVGATYDPDFLTMTELGFKSIVADGSLRLNGALYLSEWDDIQLGFYDPAISLLALVDNVGKAESDGFEIDVKYIANDKLSISGGLAKNDAELHEDYFLQGTLTGKKGQDLPLTPDLKYNFTVRYEPNENRSIQFNYVYVDEMWNELDINSRVLQDSYGLANLSFSFDVNDSSSVQLYIDNVFDEVAELYINNQDVLTLTSVNRPMTLGLKYTWNLKK